MKAFLLALGLISCLVAPVRAQAERTEAGADAPVYVIPIRGQIEGALLYVIRRGLAEAEQQNAAAVVLVMDTPGGTLGAASDIVRSIQAAKRPVYTLVEKDAFSAGAIIALSTKAIYMAPGSVIGDALPIGNEGCGVVVKAGASPEAQALMGKTVALLGGEMYAE